MTSEKVRNALLHYDICHRSREFEKLYKRLCTKVLKIFDADDSYKSVLISGSGTAANEAVLFSVFRPGDKALLIRNGEFGDRLKQMLDQYKIPYADCRFEWGTRTLTNYGKNSPICAEALKNTFATSRQLPQVLRHAFVTLRYLRRVLFCLFVTLQLLIVGSFFFLTPYSGINCCKNANNH